MMKQLLRLTPAGLCALVALVAGGCTKEPGTSNTGATNASRTSPAADDVSPLGAPENQAASTASVTLNPTQGNEVKGTVLFTGENNGVRVVADITGLTPGEHGFHIHEKGDCSAPDASSAGGHFNPTGMPHGGPDSGEHHLGDMGNITADASGNAHLDRVFSFLTLSGSNSIIGHALIVHGGRDDLTSQPSGDAGARVACGVIEKQ